EALKAFGCASVPFVHRIQRPPGGLVKVAIGARVGSAQLHRQVGARNPYAVIATRIDHHVGPRWHVTLDTARAGRSDFVEVMFRRVILLCEMTLQTDTVAVCAKLGTVRLMAIAARHAGLEHPALNEGAVFVVLLLYLSVGKIQVFVEQRDAIVVARGLSVDIVFVNLTATRVTSRAHLYFSLRLTRRSSTRVSGRRIDHPYNPSAFIQRDRQAFVGKILPIALLLCPRHVIRPRPVARFTSNVDSGVGRVVSARLQVVVLANISRMAVGAHVIPVLIDAGPMPRISKGDLLTGIEKEPSLAAALARAAVPCHSER